MEPYQVRNQHFEALFANPDLIEMGQNTNHLPTHPDVKRAMIESIEAEEYHAYAPPAGMEELRRLMLADYGVDGADVLVTDGAVEGLYHACRHLMRPGERMITTDPGWKWPAAFSRLSGGEVVALPIYDAAQDYKLTPAQLETAVADGGARLIYLIDPLNPLGIMYTADEIAAFARIARDADAYLIHDCTYRHFAEGHTLAFDFYPERTITTYSCSKWLGIAGLRIGGLIAIPSLIETLSDGQPNSLGSNVVSQRAAIAGLKAKPEWFPEVQRVQRGNQALIHDAVAPINGLSMPVYPSQGNFIVIDSSAAGIKPETLCELYLERNILVRHAGYHTERFADRFIKVGTTVPREHAERFCTALPEVVAAALDAGATSRAFF